MPEESPSDKFFGKFAEGVYEDGLKPSVSNLGETIGFVFKAISYYPRFWGKVLDIKWEDKVAQFEKEYKERFDKIKEEDKTLPSPKMLGPIVQSLEYSVFEDELRKMFANLLASSCDVNSKAHPAFVEIIRQLDAEEARLIQNYSSDWINGEFPESLPIIKIYIDPRNYSDVDVSIFDTPIELNSWRLIRFEDAKSRSPGRDWSYVGYVYPKEYDSNNMFAQIDNLERLGIIRFEDDYREVVSGNSLGPFTQDVDAAITRFSGAVLEDFRYDMDYEVGYLTKLGRNFVSACVAVDESEEE
ncbi:DUF4393 domain-containing protein [Deinococcus aestuarii]|uniref:DUF4393 domain-containing protein n=1 Tax=Deinococcus aestuarii TaxID=2774531 RepID=UPI001C0E6AC7|nr:DUF4393 domain-containing protein [Deinococcus aestuarii]